MRENVKGLDLKKILMELGNKLVFDYGYEPATTIPEQQPSTHMIQRFTVWMNENPEAQEVLKSLGLDWSIPKRTK